MNGTEHTVTLSKELVEQIGIVRDTGMTNMFDRRTVRRIASMLGLVELVNFLGDRNGITTYWNFILHGESLEVG